MNDKKYILNRILKYGSHRAIARPEKKTIEDIDKSLADRLYFEKIGDYTYRRRISYQIGSIGIEHDSIGKLFEVQQRAVTGRQRFKHIDYQMRYSEGLLKDKKYRAVFFDAETTGLSSGAGSIVFLLGIAYIEGKNLSFEQFFLSDYPGEPEYLSIIKKTLEPFDIFVSYNGKSYDSHIIESRFLMNGMEYRIGEQLDLLHIARRLWANVVGSCSLKDIEESILGEKRVNDIPGYEIPDRYFNFLETGNVNGIKDIVIHNEKDILSLVKLVGVISGILDGRYDSPFDKRAFGQYLEKAGLPVFEKYLREEYEQGGVRAGIILSLHHKRMAQWERAIEIWNGLKERKSIFAAVELAKYYEHRLKDYKKALLIVNEIFKWNIPVSTEERRSLVKRLERLKNKLRKTG